MYHYVALGDSGHHVPNYLRVASGGRNVTKIDLNKCELEMLPAII